MGVFGLGAPEVAVCLVVAAVILGPDKLGGKSNCPILFKRALSVFFFAARGSRMVRAVYTHTETTGLSLCLVFSSLCGWFTPYRTVVEFLRPDLFSYLLHLPISSDYGM